MNSRLGAESLFVVRRSVRRFTREYDVRSYPLNCFRLLYTLREEKHLRLDIVETSRLSAAFDAVDRAADEEEARRQNGQAPDARF